MESTREATVTEDGLNALSRSPSAGDEASHQAIAEVVAKLCAGGHYHDERREHARFPVAVSVIVTPLSDDGAVAGAPMAMMTLNISLGGAALIHKAPCDAPFAALNFTPAGVTCTPIILRVLRHSRIGAMYVMAGDFVGGHSLSGPTPAL